MMLQKATGTSPETPAVSTNNVSNFIATIEDVKKFTAPLPQLAVEYSRGSGTYDNEPEQCKAESFSEFWQRINDDRGSAKGQQFICAPLNKGLHNAPKKYQGEKHYRLKQLVKESLFIGFDVDAVPKGEFRKLREAFGRFSGCTYSTSSHTQEAPRVRAFIALSRLVSNQERIDLGKSFGEWVKAQGINGVDFDTCVYNGCQPCFLPLKDATFEVHNSVLALDVDALLSSVHAVCRTERKKTPATSSQSMLQPVSEIPANTFDNIAQALQRMAPGAWDGSAHIEVGADKSKIDYALCCDIARVARGVGIAEQQLQFVISTVFMRSGAAQHLGRKSNPEDYVKRTAEKAQSEAGTLEAFVIDGAPLLQNGVPVSIDPLARGDVANAELYAAANRGKLLYVTEHKQWIRWDGNRWAICIAGEEVDAAKKVGKSLIQEAARLIGEGDEAQAQKRLARGAQAQQEARIKAMINLASSEEGMRISATALDKDPLLLGVHNGVAHLGSGKLLAPAPEMYITKGCNAAFDPKCACPRWLQFLNDIFPNDSETIESVQRILGYTLTGLSTEEKIILCVGYGSNGKSVFGNVIHRIMGDYAQQANGSLLAARRTCDTSPRDDIAALAGCRYVGINETQAGDMLDAKVVKMLAGREPITARNLYSGQFTFVPQFTPWLRTNHKPIVRDTDDGIWRRLVVLPFARKFSEAEQDPMLERKLIEEQDGILAWMIAGAQNYLSRTNGGLKLSHTIKSNGREYRTESDLLGLFLEELTEQNAESRIDQSVLFEVWSTWCKSNGTQQGTKTSFTRRLKERGFNDAKSGASRFYCGLELLPTAFGDTFVKHMRF